MSVQFPQPRHMPCSDCGGAVERASKNEHVCDRARLLDFRMFQLRDEVAAVENEVGAFFDSPRGRFELWYAERQRRTRGTD